MERVYPVTGMTCGGCAATVQRKLSEVAGVRSVTVDHSSGSARVQLDGSVEHAALSQGLQGTHYQLIDVPDVDSLPLTPTVDSPVAPEAGGTSSWWTTYRPLLLVFAFLTGISLLTSLNWWGLNGEAFMRHFMAGFFLTFAFFKLLDPRGFADSYAIYDPIAKRIRVYGFIYPFIELGLGVAYLMDIEPFFTNAATMAVMGISLVGVVLAVSRKQRIQCACLGTVFNLPMSTVTIVEDLLMIVMAAAMLLMG